MVENNILGCMAGFSDENGVVWCLGFVESVLVEAQMIFVGLQVDSESKSFKGSFKVTTRGLERDVQ